MQNQLPVYDLWQLMAQLGQAAQKPQNASRAVVLSSYYDAASVTPERDFGSFASTIEDHHFNTGQRQIVLSRFRREVRNNPYLAGLVLKFAESIGNSRLHSRTSKKLFNDLKNRFWRKWRKKVTSLGDSLSDIEDIIWSEMLLAGEIFIVLLNNGRIQVIPSEYCGSPIGITDEKETNGIRYNSNNTPIGYRFGKLNKVGLIDFSESEVIPARNVIHIFRKDRVLMGRGLPWLLPALTHAHDLYEITRAKTKQIKDVNNISGTIETEISGDMFSGLESKPEDEEEETEDSPADKDDSESPVLIELKPGQFIALRPGEKLNMLKSQYHAQDYKELIMLMLHAVSTPIGMPVELWFSGLGDVNFSGFKGLGTQWNARRRKYLEFIENKFLNRLQFWRCSKASNEDDLPENPDGDHDLISWAWRQTAVLDDERKAKSDKIRMESGEIIVSDLWEDDGNFPEEIFEKRRQVYIKLLQSARVIDEGDDGADVEVPLSFILRGKLPEEMKGAAVQPNDNESQKPEDKNES